jgi:hypothetical protein
LFCRRTRRAEVQPSRPSQARQASFIFWFRGSDVGVAHLGTSLQTQRFPRCIPWTSVTHRRRQRRLLFCSSLNDRAPNVAYLDSWIESMGVEFSFVSNA